MKRESNLNLSDNEVDDAACSILLVSKISCSKLHYKKGFDLILLSYKIVRRGEDAEPQTRTTIRWGTDAANCAEFCETDHVFSTRAAVYPP